MCVRCAVICVASSAGCMHKHASVNVMLKFIQCTPSGEALAGTMPGTNATRSSERIIRIRRSSVSLGPASQLAASSGIKRLKSGGGGISSWRKCCIDLVSCTARCVLLLTSIEQHVHDTVALTHKRILLREHTHNHYPCYHGDQSMWHCYI